MKYWENGFYLEQNENGTRKEITDDRWQELLDAQSKGMEIYIREDGYPDIKEPVYTLEDNIIIREQEIKQRLSRLSQDFIQDYVGEKIENLESKKAEFISIHNELRILQNKLPKGVK